MMNIFLAWTRVLFSDDRFTTMRSIVEHSVDSVHRETNLTSQLHTDRPTSSGYFEMLGFSIRRCSVDLGADMDETFSVHESCLKLSFGFYPFRGGDLSA